MKTINVNVQIQLDIDESKDELVQVHEAMANLNDLMLNSSGNPSIFVDEINEQDIFYNEDSEDIYPQVNTCVSIEDVEQVAKGLGIELSDEQIQEVLLLYPSEQEEDPTATWNLVVEKIIYDITD